MVRIEPLKKTEVAGEVKALFEAMEKQFGMIPNLFATMAHYPKALKPMMSLYQALAKESSIDPGLQELANLEASRINGCHYCTAHHAQMAKMYGVAVEKIEHVKSGTQSNIFSDKEKTTIAYAGCVTKDAENVPEGLYTKLKTHFSQCRKAQRK